jgi:hypothetical protein
MRAAGFSVESWSHIWTQAEQNPYFTFELIFEDVFLEQNLYINCAHLKEKNTGMPKKPGIISAEDQKLSNWDLMHNDALTGILQRNMLHATCMDVTNRIPELHPLV